MIKLYDKKSTRPLGTITEEQLQFLIDQLEEESSTDKEYYINRDTLDIFEGAGADPQLMSILRSALGEGEEMDIRWERT